jgi:hypothetical protein
MKDLKTSKFEILVRKYLNYYFPSFEVLYNERPSFLKNEKTGRNCELDIWYKDLGFAVEVNGISHKLKQTRERDDWKKEKCAENGIQLFSVANIYQIIGKKRKLFEEIKNHLHLNGFHSLADSMGQIPRDLLKEFWDYRPNKMAFGNLHAKVKRQLHWESVFDVQRKEREFLQNKLNR